MLNRILRTQKFFSSNIKKSIYPPKKEQNNLEDKVELLGILDYGYPESRYLRETIEEYIQVASIPKLKTLFLSLKHTAAHHNLYSLSFPQLKVSLNAFCIHKDLSQYKWINTDSDVKLNPQDYEVYVNPRIVAASKINHFDYELCSSFKIIKAKAKRPLALVASYFNEDGIPQQKQLYDFEARVFSHEYDHLKGIPMIHWRVSEGDIIVTSNEPFENLKYTIEYYKNRIIQSKLNTPDYFNVFDTVQFVNSGHDEFVDDQMMVDYELKNKKAVNYENVMMIDIEKAIRKDYKLILKRSTQNKNKTKIEDNIENNEHKDNI